ncbi:ATP-BINDING CASSETTE TRANSPORTER, partial [Salix purpurea]
MSKAIISKKRFSQLQGREDEEWSRQSQNESISALNAEIRKTEMMVLPFVPLTMTFKDVQYFVDTPPEMRGNGFSEKKLQLLSDITGAFKPGVLTALMGVSGAGKTTLMDVLSGRKTGGIIEGDIRIGGYPKVQQTFARISGYCEQNDIHSPQITVEESIIYSAWLRLPPEIDEQTKSRFVEEVIETIELQDI